MIVPAESRVNNQQERVTAIQVDGNHRIESGTILSYLLLQQGDPFDPDKMDRSFQTLSATGLFEEVSIARSGTTLVVHVVERPV